MIDKLKAKWAAMWGSKDDRDTMFIINAQDADFKEMSSTSVDMQLNQTQETIDKELMKLFGTNDGLLTEETVKNAVLPVLDMIEAALDQDMLMESEKKDHYFAFDTRELLRGDINQRYQAYATALSQNFIQLDEVRKMEDLPPLGINFIKLGLNDVLLDPKTGTIYTPNTNQYAAMGKSSQIPLTDEENESIIENEIRSKGRNYIKLANGKFNGSEPSSEGYIKGIPSGRSVATAEEKKNIRKELIGVKTSTDIIVTGVWDHACDRMIERGFTTENVKTVLTSDSASAYPGNTPGRTGYQKDELRVIVKDGTGEIVSAVWLNPDAKG